MSYMLRIMLKGKKFVLASMTVVEITNRLLNYLFVPLQVLNHYFVQIKTPYPSVN